MELRTTPIFERFSTTVSKNKQRYAESDPRQADLHALDLDFIQPSTWVLKVLIQHLLFESLLFVCCSSEVINFSVAYVHYILNRTY